ncbi:MAG TPA: hypothetical protein VFX45_02855 [Solirubrobacterales bacterium]|nr:hypothetical protein [Solirubrobacterales bacterium]
MNRDFVEAALTERAAAANGLTVGDEQVRQLVWDARRPAAATSQPRRVRRGRMSLATGFACLLLGGVIASAATGTIGSALDPFLGGGDPPGTPLAVSERPTWLDPAYGEATVIASAGGVRLMAYRQGGDICFQYGSSVGECATPSYYAEEMSKSSWLLRGPTSPGDKKFQFGFVDDSIASVRVEYGVGPATETATENGGFVVELDESRQPERLVGLDASGAEVISGSPYTG